jgi:hypothetical protein
MNHQNEIGEKAEAAQQGRAQSGNGGDKQKDRAGLPERSLRRGGSVRHAMQQHHQRLEATEAEQQMEPDQHRLTVGAQGQEQQLQAKHHRRAQKHQHRNSVHRAYTPLARPNLLLTRHVQA